MADPRTARMAKVLVGYSAQVSPGDRVLIEAETAAEPLVREVFRETLRAGGHPHLAIALAGLATQTGLDDIFLSYASDEQLDYTPTFYRLAYETFEARIRIWSESNVAALTNVPVERLARRERALSTVSTAQFARGDSGEFQWVTTLFPTAAYAQLAEMSLEDYEDYVYQACHVHAQGEDPIATWEKVEHEQQAIVDRMNGSKRVSVRGPNIELELSVEGRTFINACGHRNMPDGEVYTGPVEDSVNGWVRFTVPSSLKGNRVEGVELRFEAGQVVHAIAGKNQPFLEKMLETDPGARYVGEFALGLNESIRRPTGKILFDEKMGGTLHIALGAGYPRSGSVNKSAIHWDLITEMKDGGEIEVDGEMVYQDGAFLHE